MTAPTYAAWLRFDLLVDELSQGGFYCESYGVSVINLRSGETEQVRHITLRREVIERLLALLERNAVSPVTLRDVVEDFIAEIS